MNPNYFLYASFFFCTLFVAKSAQLAAQNPTFQADTLNYRLYPTEQAFLLINRSTKKDYAIPKSWLTPPKNEAYEDYESELMEYDSVVTVFPLGEHLLGVHLSSYYIGGGSMALAQGLDVFLALDTATNEVLPEVLHLGITKRRSKFMGYVSAEYTHFLVSRHPGSKFFSLITFQEKIYVNFSEELTAVTGPYYEQTPFHWYIFDGIKWSYDATLDKYLPLGEGSELPLLGLSITPVAWAKKECQRRALKGF